MLSMRITFVLAALLALSQEPWVGTWKLNIAKSTADRDARYKRAISKIEPWQDGLKVTYDLVGMRGGVTHMEWMGKFDGKDYSVQGVDYVLTHAYTLLNDRSYEITIKIDGIVTAIAKVEVSPDGRTLTTLTNGKDGRGNNVRTIAVYEKQ